MSASGRWRKLTDKFIDLDSLREAVQRRSAVDNLGLPRSALWAALLVHGTVDSKTWASEERAAIDRYLALQESYGRDHFADEDSGAEIVLDPLRGADEEWCGLVAVDVKRTFPELPYFAARDVREGLARILHYYGREHPSIGYRQGMHELAAVVLYVVRVDRGVTDQTSRRDRDEAEAHAYVLFAALMDRVSPLYVAPPADPTGVVARAQGVQNSILKASDPDLAALLDRSGVEPQLWAISWFRLLFLRVFPFESTLRLWDYLLAADAGSSLEILDYVAAVLLMRIRQQLFAEEAHDRVMTLIFGYAGTLMPGRYDRERQGDAEAPPTFPPEPSAAQTAELYDIVENAVYLRAHLDYAGGQRVAEHFRGAKAAHSRGNTLGLPTLFDAAARRLDGVSQALDIEGRVRTVRSLVDRAGRSPSRSPAKSPMPPASSAGLAPQSRSTAVATSSNARNETLAEQLDDSLTVLERELFGSGGIEVRRALDRLRHVRECLLDPEIPAAAKHAPGHSRATSNTSELASSPEPANAFHTPARKTLAQSDFSWMLASPKQGASGFKGKRQDTTIDIFELAASK